MNKTAQSLTLIATLLAPLTTLHAAQGPHRDSAWIYKGTLKEKP